MRSIFLNIYLDFCTIYTSLGGMGDTLPSTLYTETLTVDQ